MLEDPKFKIIIQQEKQGENLAVSAKIKALENISDTEVSIQIAVVEKSVVSDSKTYKNVLRTFLPDAAGSLIERNWLIDDSTTVNQLWNIPDGINMDSLVTVVFVQDEETKEIYQASFSDTLSTITAIDDILTEITNTNIIVYPNPAYNEFNIKLNSFTESNLQIELYNNIGNLVKSSIILKGENFKTVEVNELPSGIYYLKIQNERYIGKSVKILITR